MEECFVLLRSKDTKERLQALVRAQNLAEHLDLGEVTELTDISLDLLKDNNFKVCLGILLVLTKAVSNSGDHFKHQLNSLLPSVVERLGDGKQPVREAGRRLLLALMEALTPVLIFDKIGDAAWCHKAWRVREEFTRTCTAALSLFGHSKLPVHKLILPLVLKLLEDSNSGVREASMACIEELYRHIGGPLFNELQKFSIRPAQMKEITARLEQIEPLPSAPSATHLRLERTATAPATVGRHQSPAKRALQAETHGSSGAHGTQRVLAFGAVQRPDSAKSTSAPGRGLNDDDVARFLAATCEKPVTAIKIYSERELAKELEKAAAILVPEQDWSARMTAMQRLCGLVLGGAAELESFPSMLKQLWEPLGSQLADRRSSIVKQACHLLMLLAQEMHLDFEPSAEYFIPSLFKLVVITVLVIAESSDSCIKTLLHFCRCARILPKVLETAMKDRAGGLRTKCCEYALLTLERWQEAPEIQKTGQLYEDMIRCCVGDALSEVRAGARQCYQVFALVWPERSKRLFSSLDTSTQKLLQEEQRNGSKPKSPTGREKSSLFRQPSGVAPREASSRETTPREVMAHPMSAQKELPASHLSGSARTVGVSSQAAERGAALGNDGDSGGYAAGMQRRIAERAGPGPYSVQRLDGQHDLLRSATGMLRSASAEDILEGQKGSLRGHGLSKPLRVDAGSRGSSRDGHVSDDLSAAGPSTPHILGGGHMAARRVPHKAPPSERDSEPESVHSDDVQANRNAERARQMGARRVAASMQLPPPTPGGPPKQENPPPIKASRSTGSQPRTSATSASSGSSRPPSSRDDVIVSRQQTSGSRSSEQDDVSEDPWSFSEPVPLLEALASGFDPEGTWTNRVAAFQAVVTSLQQSENGAEVAGCFKRVMKLYLAHLGEQHHKVAYAALSSLADVIRVPACSRLFESYLERVLPLVFVRVIDSKDNIRQAAARVLNACKDAYSGDILLQPLIRSLDEQRSVKAKVAVADFGISALVKPPLGAGEASWCNLTLLKQWLARLVALTTDKNPKIKEVGAKALISAFEHLDSNTVLNVLLSMQVEEQVALRRLLQKYTARIDNDFLQIQTIRQKKYKVTPANGAAMQADPAAPKRIRAPSQRSHQKEETVPEAEYSGAESENLEDTHSEQTTRENRVKQWVEIEARKALIIPAEALGVRPAGKTSVGSLESLEDRVTEAEEQAVAELQRRLSNADQQTVSMSSAAEAVPGRPKSYAEMYSERKKSLSSAPKDASTPQRDLPGIAIRSPEKQGEAAASSRSISPANVLKPSNPGERAKILSPAKRTPQSIPKGQTESSPLEQLSRRSSNGSRDGKDIESRGGKEAPPGQAEAPLERRTPLKTSAEWQRNGSAPEGPVNVLGNGMAVHKLDSFDSDSGSDDGWTEAEGLGYAGLQGKVLQVLPDPTRNQRMAALKDVKKACKIGDAALWEKHYWHFYQVVLEAMNDEDASLKERALRVLEKMLSKHGCGSDDVVVSVVNKLVSVHRDRSASVSRSAEGCLEAVLAQVDPERSLQLLKAVSQTTENRTIVLSISMKQKVIARLSAEELEAHLPFILPELFEQFGSPFPDIRKAVVLCLVEMYMTMGNDLIPHLAQLSDMQRRLVSIYAKKISENRLKEKQDALAG